MPENTNERIKQNAKNGNEEARERGARILNNRDLGTLVTEHENPEDSTNNFLNAKVVDVIELLNSKENNETIIKLNRLKEYGVTDEMIVSIYKDYSGNLTNKEAALETLDIIFKRLVTYISDLPNAIVLNPETGQIDKDASIAQGYEHGIYSDNTELFFIEKSDDDSIIKIPNILKDEISSYMKYDEFVKWEFDTMMSLFDTIELKEEFKNRINNNLDNNVENLDVPFKLKKALLETRQHIENSIYEKDPDLYEITSLELARYKAEGEEKEKLTKEIEKFYEAHPEYVGKVKITERDGKTIIIDENGKKDNTSLFRVYKKSYEFEQVAAQLNGALLLSKEEFEALSPDDKKIMTIALFKGYSYRDKKNENFEMLASNCTKVLNKFFPELNLSNKGLEGNGAELARIAKDILGIEIECEMLNAEAFNQFNNAQMSNLVDDYLRHNKDVFKNKEPQTPVMSKEEYCTTLEKFFEGSNVKFSEFTAENFEYTYHAAVTNSWIENKDMAILLRYLSLQSMKEQLEKSPDSDYASKKVAEIDEAMKEFQEKHGEKFRELYGNPEKWSEREKKAYSQTYNNYKNNSSKAEIVKSFTADFAKFQNGITYENMSKDEKKAYIRNTLALYKSINSGTNKTMAPIVLRRLELMNTDEKQIVTFDEEGNPTINEEMILQEYKSLSSGKYEWKSFEELQNVSEQKKELYAMETLGKVVELHEKEFKILGSKANVRRCFMIIQDYKQTLKQKESKQNENPISDKEFAAAMKVNGMRAEILVDTAVTTLKQEDKTQNMPGQNPGNVIERNNSETIIQSVGKKDGADEIEIKQDDTQISQKIEENVGIIGRLGKAFSKIKDKIFGKNPKQKRLPEATGKLQVESIVVGSDKRKKDENARNENVTTLIQNNGSQNFDERMSLKNWETRENGTNGYEPTLVTSQKNKQDTTRDDGR